MTKKNISPKVCFYHMKDNSSKIQFICTKAQEAFQKEKRLLITVSNIQAAEYIDALLWRSPLDSFMPHMITNSATSEWVAITMQEQENVNQATHLLNLCSNVPSLYQQVDEIYELYDETNPQKLDLSLQRMHFYEQSNLQIEISN